MAVGYRSLLIPWVGGAGLAVAAATVGFKSPLATWVGGAAVNSAPTVGYRSTTHPWVGGASIPATKEPIKPPPHEEPPGKEPVVPPKTDVDGHVLRVEYWTLEGDFANIEYTDDCFNHCPDCGGVVPSGSGSGQTVNECPPLTWLNGWQVHYCSGTAPYPPGTVSIPGGVNQLLAQAVCNYTSHLIVAGGFSMGPNGCETGNVGSDPVLTPLGFYPDVLITQWTQQGSPVYFPGQEPPGTTPSTSKPLHLLVQFREYDIPGDVEIISKECVEVPICTCDHGSGSGSGIGGPPFVVESGGIDTSSGSPPPEVP